MKKILILTLALILSFTTFGCTPVATNEPTPTEPVVSVPSPTPTPGYDIIGGGFPALSEPLDSVYNIEGDLELDNSLIRRLVIQLKCSRFEISFAPYNFARYIENIIDQGEAYHVKFSNNTPYFVCGYYNEDADNDKNESYLYKYAKYTWVGYQKPEDIKGYYGDKKLAVSFQINTSDTCERLFPDSKENAKMEHYRYYYPQFVNGVNITPQFEFEDEFIYTYSIDDTSYYSNHSNLYNRDTFTFPFTYYEDKLCLIIRMNYWDGSPAYEDRLGKFFDELDPKVITKDYIIDETQYALFYFDDIAELVSREIAKNNKE